MEKNVTRSKNDEIALALSKIKGQEQLVKEVLRLLKIFHNSSCSIKPHFFLTGSSGAGKTHTIETLCKVFEFGFLPINGASLTKEGTSGNSLSKALSPMLQRGNKPTIIFVDEFDKLFITGNQNSGAAHETTHGVQNEFLKVLEGKTASVFGDYGKYLDVSMENCLFIFAGAFNGERNIDLDRLRALGVKTEFLGRVGLVFNASELSMEHLLEILDESPLLDSYINLFTDITREKAVEDISLHMQANFKINPVGARMVNTLIHQYFIGGGVLSKEVVDQSTIKEKINMYDM